MAGRIAQRLWLPQRGKVREVIDMPYPRDREETKRYELYKRLMIALSVGMIKKQIDGFLNNLPRVPNDTEPFAFYEAADKAATRILSTEQWKKDQWKVRR